MKFGMKNSLLTGVLFFLAGCSVFGKSGVEIAPYTVLQEEENFQVRHYESLVLVTTPMATLDGQRGPFGKLFKYISGDNDETQKIEMTAPVFMDQDQGESDTMSFVLPESFSLDTAPEPDDPSVNLESIEDYTVATIRFSGRLTQENIQAHREQLDEWIKEKGLEPIGPAKAAGYNPPFTIPAMRRNEVLIPIQINDTDIATLES